MNYDTYTKVSTSTTGANKKIEVARAHMAEIPNVCFKG